MILLVGGTSSPTVRAEIRLPDLGDGSSSRISPQREKILGQAWLRAFRAQVRTSSDPLMYEYIEQLLQDLAPYSQLRDYNLDLVIIPSPTINAFAVPGGVVGVNTGLFLYAGTENQMASVLTHELAHLSQRHFARSLEQQANSTIPTMAGLLASLILAAATGSTDAGLAALSATQAAALDSQLRFSRQNEQEADRLGFQTMIASGRNPEAGAEMFERMLRELRYTSRPPEFLLTHPVTESRVADARNRAQKFEPKQYEVNQRFYLMQARARLIHSENPNVAAKIFRHELDGETASMDASRYGLGLALTDAGQFDEAAEQLRYLIEKDPNEVAYITALAKLESKQGNAEQAITRLYDALQSRPQSHPLNVALSEVLMDAGRYSQAELILTNHSERRPKDDYVWYLLAEVRGLAGNILGLHEARAEYFILNGIYDKARIQLNNALKIADSDYKKALLEQRLEDVDRLANEKI
ncbi:M48 family metallopeptidase [Sessilibacter sp. MAH4]